MFDETKMVAPTQNYGYSSNSKAQATQVWDALNDARGAGMIQGLGLLAMGASSPQTLMSTIGSQYDNGETRSILGQIGKTIGDETGLTSLVGDSKIADRFKTAIDLAERGPGIFTIEPLRRRSVASDPRDMTDVVNPEINQDLVNRFDQFRIVEDKTPFDPTKGRTGVTKEGEPYVVGDEYFKTEPFPGANLRQRGITDDKQFRLERGSLRRDIPGQYTPEFLTRDQFQKEFAQLVNRPQKAQMKSPVNTEVKKSDPVVTTKVDAKQEQEPSFFDTVLNFFKSSGSPVTPNQDDLGASNDAVEKRKAQPTQKEVAAIAQEAAKIPEEVQKTITSAGLLPQYLALIRAGYTAERAIKAIGLPAGTAIA
jgi:hypothetical protein